MTTLPTGKAEPNLFHLFDLLAAGKDPIESGYGDKQQPIELTAVARGNQWVVLENGHVRYVDKTLSGCRGYAKALRAYGNTVKLVVSR